MILPHCKTCDSQNCFINRFTTPEWKATIDKKRVALRIKKNDDLFREGDPVNGIYFIYEGKFKVFNSGYKNKTQIVRLAKSGNIIGHRGFGSLKIYPIGATALSQSTVCFIPEKTFKEALKNNGELVFELLNFYADELRRAEYKLRSLSQMSARQKLAEALLTINEIFDSEVFEGEEYLGLQLPRQDYADITGSSLEEVIRTLSAFNKEGIISLVGKRIKILKLNALKEMISSFGPLKIP
ncbi:MAG: Crp/Fnr family transcriptional regulator [Bacteroidia bacterium]|nr:Crp/Fnr family transcriptional regulator [Bacteroidia bacterium]